MACRDPQMRTGCQRANYIGKGTGSVSDRTVLLGMRIQVGGRTVGTGDPHMRMNTDANAKSSGICSVTDSSGTSTSRWSDSAKGRWAP